MNEYNLDHLDELEAESIFVLREVAAQFQRPAILFSGGKDSIVVTHLAAKAFAPARIHSSSRSSVFWRLLSSRASCSRRLAFCSSQAE